MDEKEIYCSGCDGLISARLTDGKEIYPHRRDLFGLPFWKCDACGNYVGCHHKTANRTKPLGCISTPELRRAKQHIHRILDPLWQSKRMSRSAIYKRLSGEIGRKYHTAEIRNISEARTIYALIRDISTPPTDGAA